MGGRRRVVPGAPLWVSEPPPQSGRDVLFEPPDCKKGDPARIGFNMRLTHGVVMNQTTSEMLNQWSTTDPVSPEESLRNKWI